MGHYELLVPAGGDPAVDWEKVEHAEGEHTSQNRTQDVERVRVRAAARQDVPTVRRGQVRAAWRWRLPLGCACCRPQWGRGCWGRGCARPRARAHTPVSTLLQGR